MSLQYLTAAWKLSLPSTQKFTLVALADRANDDGVCWPSQRHLSEMTGLSVRTIQDAIRALAKAGYLIFDRRFNRSSVFKVTIPDVKARPTIDRSVIEFVATCNVATPNDVKPVATYSAGVATGNAGPDPRVMWNDPSLNHHETTIPFKGLLDAYDAIVND